MVAELGRTRRPVGTCLVFFAVVALSWSSASMEESQDQLMELAAKNLELTQGLATVETSTATLTPQQVVMSSVIDTRLLKQSAAFDGDRTKWIDSAFTFRAYASAVSTRMVVLMKHAQGAIESMDLPTAPSDRQANAQLCSVLAMVVN